MPQTTNPLSRFFRQPAIYLRLPSQGKNWPPGSLEMPETGELPVYPMTAIDEITYRTPDALFNGEAVVSVIQSCVPAIVDAWKMPNIDMDSILVAIRIASYGHNVDVGTQCPACNTESEFGLDLRTVIDKLGTTDYSQPLVIGDLSFYFRPLTYREFTINNQVQFEQQKTMQILNDAEVSESDKVSQLNSMMKRILEVTVTAIAQSISEIRTAESITVEQTHILEFLTNCDRTVFNQIRDHVIKAREASEMQPLKITCPDCQNKYEQAFTLDMSRFFESAS